MSGKTTIFFSVMCEVEEEKINKLLEYYNIEECNNNSSNKTYVIKPKKRIV